MRGQGSCLVRERLGRQPLGKGAKSALRRSATRPNELNDVRDAPDAAARGSAAESGARRGVRDRRRGAQRRRPAANGCEKQRSYRSRPVLHSGLTRGCLHGRKPLERRPARNSSARRKSPGTGSETSVTRALLVGSAAPPGAALTRVSGEGSRSYGREGGARGIQPAS